MKVFWYNGGLQILPENESDSKLLVQLTNNLKLEKPPEMQNCIPSGDTPSGDGLFELLVGNKQPGPSSFTGKSHNQKQVVCINELP